MVELPNKARVVISDSKVSNYLLSETHAIGKSKARFFRSFGFNEANIEQFKQALSDLAQNESVTDTLESLYGVKYVIDGQLKTPNGITIHVRTVWIIEVGDDTPRLVTAHPLD